MLPLIYLLMKRDLQLFRMATKVKLGEDELWDSADSIVWVQRAVEYRVEDLQSTCHGPVQTWGLLISTSLQIDSSSSSLI